MADWQLFMIHVSWRERNVVSDVSEGYFPVEAVFDASRNRYEAAMQAYAEGNERLAIKTARACSVDDGRGNWIPLAEYHNEETGEKWWFEQGKWNKQSKYHDAPSFHRPGCSMRLKIGADICIINLFTPALDQQDFNKLLSDIENWCWEMAVDDQCYVTHEMEQEQSIKTGSLSPVFLQCVSNFIKSADAVLKRPQAELRECVELQKLERLRPNSHSMRYLAQCGERPSVPGRSVENHFNIPENRFVCGMVKYVMRILRSMRNFSDDIPLRLENAAKEYEQRVEDLKNTTHYKIDQEQLERDISEIKTKRAELLEVCNIPGAHVYAVIKVRSGAVLPFELIPQYRCGYSKLWATALDNDRAKIIQFENKGKLLLIASIANLTKVEDPRNGDYWRCDISRVYYVGHWREYNKELKKLEESKQYLENNNWQQAIPQKELDEIKKESISIERRVQLLRNKAVTCSESARQINAFLAACERLDKNASKLGITPELRFLPTMIFLQSPSYSGVLSAYREFMAVANLTEDDVEPLLMIKNFGMRDWPALYERWCIISLIRVLDEEYHFKFDKTLIKKRMLKYCTGSKTKTFAITAINQSLGISLCLDMEKEFVDKKRPDYMLTFIRDNGKREQTFVLDAKSCAFKIPASVAEENDEWQSLGACLRKLVVEKNYGRNGAHPVFILHSSPNCIATPSTLQSWAKSSYYGGNAVFGWQKQFALDEDEGIVSMDMPGHACGAVMVRPYRFGDLKRLLLLFFQMGESEIRLCPSCGSSGDAISVIEDRTIGGNKRLECTCKQCNFFFVRTLCHNCKNFLYKNQTTWTYHDLNPVDPWNIKCWSCGSWL
ncbi:MAG: hypothetical protein EOL87_13795 [Spartobacteria bacterium]|nr:hypothetical protein [Spartobacteria bacterium]